MSRLTLRLPESLHQQLSTQAQREGVSLNQYIVFSLTRSVTVEDLAAQKEAFKELTGRYPAQDAEAALQEVLAERS